MFEFLSNTEIQTLLSYYNFKIMKKHKTISLLENRNYTKISIL